MVCDVLDGFIPNNHEHRDCTAQDNDTGGSDLWRSGRYRPVGVLNVCRAVRSHCRPYDAVQACLQHGQRCSSGVGKEVHDQVHRSTCCLSGCVIPTLRRGQHLTVTLTVFVVQRLPTVCKADPKTRDVMSQNTADLN
jgi:hypothetical protein